MATPRDKSKARLPTGRPSTYSEELADSICGKIAKGQSLNSICKAEGMPDLTTVYSWFRKHSVFAQNYARAKEDQADTLADEIKDISDEVMVGEKTKIVFDKATGEEKEIEITRGDMIDRARLRVDARKWIAAKLKPKKYGEAHRIEMGGEIKNTNVQADQLAKLSEEELEMFAKLMEKLSA